MTAPDLLAAIVASRRHDVEAQRRVRPDAVLAQEAEAYTPRGTEFLARLSAPDTLNVLAECKRRSPSRGVLKADYDPVAQAQAYVAGGAAAISILTEPSFFDGDLAHLRAVRAATRLPLLRKDFIIDAYQLLEAQAAGADAVLLIVSALTQVELCALHAAATSRGLAVLVEVHDVEELHRAVDAGAQLVGVNNRNLRTLAVHVRASEEVAAHLPAGMTAVSESGLRQASDLRRLRALGYHAFLVGETLMTSADPEQTLRDLRGADATAGA